MSTPSNSLKSLSEATAGIVEQTAQRIVAVHGRQWSNSSGIVIGDGIAVTAEEALDKDEDITITLPDGNKVAATLVGRDPTTDVAVLRFAGKTAVSGEPPAATARTGSLVISVGRSGSGVLAGLGMIGLVGDAWRSSQGGDIDAMIRANIALPHQAEGGALVDADGNLVGMAVFGPRRRVLAIPTATVLKAAGRILKDGSVKRGYIGVGVQPVKTEAVAGKGGRAAMVVSLDADGPAKQAGILLGDILTTWNGTPISGARGLVERLGPDSVGGSVALGVIRGGNPLTVSVVVAERSAA